MAVEFRAAGCGQGIESGQGILVVAPAGNQIQKTGCCIDDIANHIPGQWQRFLQAEQYIGHAGPGVGAGDGGGGCHIVRIHRCHITHRRAAMAVTDQIHLVCASGSQNGFHLTGQLFAAHFRTVGGSDLGDIDLGATAPQFFGNPVPVVVAGDVIKAEQPVAEHDGVTGFGIGVLEQPIEPAGMGRQTEGGQQQT